MLTPRFSFFKTARKFFSRKFEGEDEIPEIGEGVETEADKSVGDPELTTPKKVGIAPKPPMLEGQDDFHQAGPYVPPPSPEISHDEFGFRDEHTPYRFEPDTDMVVCITKAFLYEIHPLENGTSVKKHPLKNPDNPDLPLTIQVTDNCLVYSEYETDNHGRVIDADQDGIFYALKLEDAGEDGGQVDIPPSTHFELPNGEGGAGAEGKYKIPLFWIVDRKLYRTQWDNEVEDPRTTLLRGSLEGHRGPLWWVSGYNALANLGGGAKVYAQYNIGSDQKQLRSLKEKGQTEDSTNKVSGRAQIQVEEAANGNEIDIYGNRYNKHWKIGDKGVAIVEDGLVRCFQNLSCVNVSTVTLTTAQVYTSTTSVVSCVTTGNMDTDVWKGGDTNNNIIQGAPHTTMWAGGSKNDTMIQGTPHATMWAGGSSVSIGYVQVSTVGGGTAWCLGVAASGSYSSSAPTAHSFIDGADTVTGVTSVVTVTGVPTEVGQVTGVTSAVTVTGISGDVTQTNSIKSFTCVDAVVTSNPTTVYVYDGSTTKFLNPPDANHLNLVKCPVADLTNTCPDPIPPD